MKAIILIGHGGVPTDYPAEKVGRLRALESQRQRNQTPITEEEITLDHDIRHWPRTPETEPFRFGVEAIAERLAPKFADTKLVIAYNEFCAPSIEEATEQLVSEGYQDITLLTTMFTRGGVHSEFEIPAIFKELQIKYPQVQLKYPWPFNLDLVADFLFKSV